MISPYSWPLEFQSLAGVLMPRRVDWASVSWPVQNWYFSSEMLNEPVPMLGSENACHATLGEVMKLTTPGPPFGEPHCGSTVITTEYWK